MLPHLGDFKWSNLSEQLLNYHKEDAFESVSIFLDYPIITSHLIFIAQVKLKLLLDIRMLEREAKKHGSPASYETKMEWLCKHAVSDILFGRQDIVERDDWSDIKKSLGAQFAQLHERIEKRNPKYWPTLKNPDALFTGVPGHNFEAGSPEELIVMFTLTCKSWFECPPVLKAVRMFTVLHSDH
ncbi:putative mynd finger protein [Daldinia childiae]|uniref:putative mynd finger protein n=1 Tax=Daldinia childiae TaxID=326645 RepID=UPI0014480359|nr:putative mynd finger protein [Daldinia childiae]KAF3058496.1 putative mynd finger protein [Daldinia childiae]